MTLRVALSVAEIVLLVVVLAVFLVRARGILDSIIANLEKIADGVGAVRGHCALLRPGADEVNALLTEAAGHLEHAAEGAEARHRP